MATIENYDIVPLEELKSKLELYKYNPTLMHRVILDTLQDVTDGRINIVDPTNPFIFLLEASTVNTSLFIQENYLNLRRQYPSLSQTQDDIYLHMCDKDYIGRFATAGKCIFTIAVSYKDLTNAPYDVSINGTRLTIPKDTEITIDNIKFTFNYAIDIIRYSNGMIKVAYTTDKQNPLQPLSKSLINYTARKNIDKDVWIFFDVELLQTEIKSTTFPIEFGNIFNKTIPFSDKYTYCSVYYKNDNTFDKWMEMKTTHNPMVYDITDPTVILQVYESELKITLPSVYTNTEIISGELRIDIYTTKGSITVDLGNYKLVAFNNVLRAFEETEITEHTIALSNSSYLMFSDKITTGGNDGITLDQLRDRVINNSIGDRQLPVSNVQLEAYVNNNGFNLIKNIDLVTNRIFLATKKLPEPNTRKIITPATMGLTSTVINSLSLINNINVTENLKSYTIKSNSLFKLTNGVLRLLTNPDNNYLNALSQYDLMSNINDNDYYYNPFYYVYDETNPDEYLLRSYHLDQPVVNYTNFLDQNNTLQLAVNSNSVNIEKITDGYKITVITKSGGFYKQLADNRVALQLAYYPVGEKHLAYINAEMVSRTDDDERIYQITLLNNLDINKKHQLTINNTVMFTSDIVKTKIELTHNFYLIYSTDSLTSSYLSSAIDADVGNMLLNNSFKGVTKEEINVSTGYPLEQLWTKIRPIISDIIYKRYTEDIPLLYDRDIYEVDPITGSIFTVNEYNEIIYNIKHKLNDPVVDSIGNVIFKHRIGDIVLAADGEPVIEHVISVNSEVDLLLIDAKYLKVNNSFYKEYRDNIANLIYTWCSVNIASIQQLLLEQTKIFYHPSTTFSDIKVMINKERILNMSSSIFFRIKLYIKDNVTLENDLIESINIGVIEMIDTYLTNKVISVDILIDDIKNKYITIIESVQIRGINDDDSLYLIEILEDHKRFNLKKRLVMENDNAIYVQEDIGIEYITY